jgi:hypothetical protein
VDFCAANNAKTPIIRPALAVCKGKNRLTGDFLGFHARSATNCQPGTDPPAGTDPSPYAVINGDLYAVRIVRGYLPLHSPRAAID